MSELKMKIDMHFNAEEIENLKKSGSSMCQTAINAIANELKRHPDDIEKLWDNPEYRVGGNIRFRASEVAKLVK